MRRMTMSELILSVFSSKRTVFERERSTRDLSVRQMQRGARPHHILHRFPIRGGITASDLLRANVMAANPLLARLRRKA